MRQGGQGKVLGVVRSSAKPKGPTLASSLPRPGPSGLVGTMVQRMKEGRQMLVKKGLLLPRWKANVLKAKCDEEPCNLDKSY